MICMQILAVPQAARQRIDPISFRNRSNSYYFAMEKMFHFKTVWISRQYLCSREYMNFNFLLISNTHGAIQTEQVK